MPSWLIKIIPWAREAWVTHRAAKAAAKGETANKLAESADSDCLDIQHDVNAYLRDAVDHGLIDAEEETKK